MITDKLVLNRLAQILPATSAVEKADPLGQVEGDYVLIVAESRLPPRSIPRELALLLLTFRQPATVIEAVITVAGAEGENPDAILERFYESLPQLIEQRYLGYAEKEVGQDAANVAADLPPGFSILRTLNRLEDTEVLLVRRANAVSVFKHARVASAGIAARLSQEAKVLQELDGTIAPHLYHAELDMPLPHLTLQAIPGISLWELHRNALLDRWEVDPVTIAENIVCAYRMLHDRGIVHCDVHPRNMLVRIDGSICLIDFEYAGWLPDVSHSKAVGVTPFFAPEVAAAELDRRPSHNTSATDQYSVSAVVTWLITGEHHINFSPDAHRALEQIRDGDLRDIKVTEPLRSVLEKSLSTRAEERFSSMAEFETAWKKSSAPYPRRHRPRAKHRFRRWAEQMSPGGTLWSATLKPPTASLYFGLAGAVWALAEGSTVLEWEDGIHYAVPWLHRLNRLISTDDAFIAPERGLASQDSSPHRLYHDACGIDLLTALVGSRLGLANVNESVKRYASAIVDDGRTELTDGLGGYLYGCALFKLLGAGDRVSSSADRAFSQIERQIRMKLESGTIGFLGLAHGLSGECYSLMAWCLVNRQPTPEILQPALDFLEEKFVPIGLGYEMPITDSNIDSNGASWCHGSSGQVFLWRLAARLTQNPKYLEHAEMFARAVWQTDWSIHQLCCGDVGGAFALSGLADELGDGKWQQRARELYDRTLLDAYTEPDPVSLFKGQAGGALLDAQLEADVPLVFPLCGEILV
uniref:Serine/threonine protein kinase n=1 Tax=uncultured bacterium ws020C1 TaxID=1131823 RepID=I1X4K9_9BACT|nr:serine/threonine protein kinase [uncultured bacterium ws020C1]